MTFKIVGVDENNRFPARVEARLAADRASFLPAKPSIAIDKVRAILATSNRGPVVLATLGHSYVFGLNASPQFAWVTQLAQKIQSAHPSGIYGYEPPVRTLAEASVAAAVPRLPGVHVVNGGISGSYSNNYVPTATANQIGTVQPQVVFHMIGANDYGLDIGGVGMSKADFKANVTASIAAVDAKCTVPPIHVLIGTATTMSVQNPRTPWALFLEGLQELAAARPDRVGYMSVNEAFVAQGASGWGAPDPYDLIDTDNLHPNNAGHSLIAATLAEQLRLAPAQIRPVPEVFDRFERRALGSAETSQPWVVQSGSFTPTATGLHAVTDGQAVVDAGFSDAEVSAIVTFQTNVSAALILKASADTDGMRVYLSSGNNNVVVNDAGSLLTFSPVNSVALTPGREYHLAAMIKAGQLTVNVNGKLILQYVIPTALATTMSTKTMHGVRGSSTNANNRFRNFAVRRV